MEWCRIYKKIMNAVILWSEGKDYILISGLILKDFREMEIIILIYVC